MMIDNNHYGYVKHNINNFRWMCSFMVSNYKSSKLGNAEIIKT